MFAAKSITRTTFVATSNMVSSSEIPNDSSVSLIDAIRDNPAFEAALNINSASELRFEKRTGGNKPVIIQSSKDPTNDTVVIPASQGLVSAITQAYNKHHNLILRPDDIWQAILTQFSFYVTGRAETLRDKFVDFQGKKELTVKAVGTLFTADFGKIANRMVDEQIVKNIKDPDVVNWILPNFTTTTPNDRIVASISIMSTLQAFFDYKFQLQCGIPRVTLEGTVEDWKLLRNKLQRLLDYDIIDEKQAENSNLMTKWHAMLAPVLDELVASVEGNPNITFWDKICHRHGGGSGPRYLSGWVTVFACFTKDGEWQGNIPAEAPRSSSFFRRQQAKVDTEKSLPNQYPFIDTNDLPVGALSVPVLVDDNGVEYETQMVAGQFAYQAVHNSDDTASNKRDTIRPRNDWCIAYTEKPKIQE